MSTKHTPGPWATAGGSTGRYRTPTIEVRALTGGGVSQCIATVTSIAVGQANARLIAAAPELLEALRAARDYLSCIPESAAGGDDEAARLARLASSAIRKATGDLSADDMRRAEKIAEAQLGMA